MMASEPRMVEATTTVMEVDFGNRQGPSRGQPGQLGPAAPELGEADEPLGVFPEASEAEPEEAARPPRRWAGMLLALLAVGAFGGVVWFAYKWGLSSGYRDEVPTLMADVRPIKVKPENPGGMVVPNQDKLVLHQGEEGAEQQVERLLSPPEVPEPLVPAGGTGPEIASVTDPASETPAAAEPAGTESAQASESAAEAQPAETEVAASAPEPAATIAVPTETEAPAQAEAQQSEAQQTAAASPQIEASTAPAAGGSASAGAAAGAASGGASGAASGGGAAGGAGGPTLAQAAGVQVAAIQKGDYVIQLASVTSSDAASKEWSRLQRTFPSLLGDMDLAVQEATVKGTLYHRVQTGPFPSRATAQDMCAQIKAKNQACIVQRR